MYVCVFGFCESLLYFSKLKCCPLSDLLLRFRGVCVYVLYMYNELQNVTKGGCYRQATAQWSMLALQNAPVGALCNARKLH